MSFRRIARFIFFIILLSIAYNITAFSEGSIDESYIFPIVEEIMKTKNKAFVEQDENAVKALYDMSRTSGKWACEHEIKRLKYLKNWSEKQGVVFTNIDSNLVVRWTRMKDNGNMVVNMLASTSYTYTYEDRPGDVNLMRIGTYHLVELVQRDGEWRIVREWYTDPFADSLELDNLKMEQNKKSFYPMRQETSAILIQEDWVLLNMLTGTVVLPQVEIMDIHTIPSTKTTTR